MADYKNLIPNKYFNLNYSLIPDNNIQKVVGTYKTIGFTSEHNFEDDTLEDMYYLDKKDGTHVVGSLPLIAVVGSHGFYEDVYNEVVDYTTDGAFYAFKTRHERVRASYSVTVDDDMPIRFYPEDGAISAYEIQGNMYVRTGNNLTGAEGLWLSVVSDADNQLWGFASWGIDGAGTRETTTIDSLEITNMHVDSYWDGNKLYHNKFRLVVHFDVSIVDNYHECQATVTGFTGYVQVKELQGFKCAVRYYTAEASKDIEFEIHSPSEQYPYYNDYPLRIDGNEFTNGNTVINSGGGLSIPWHTWISEQLLHNYQDGKLFINTKLKASFLRDNNLDINSEVLIKDVDNQYIAKEVIEDGEVKEYRIIFSIKNIEYVYSGSEFTANVVLLETGAIGPDLSFGVHSYIVIDTSAYATVVDVKDLNAITKDCIEINAGGDSIYEKDAKGYVPFAATVNASADNIDVANIAFTMAIGAANIMFAIAFIDTVLAGFDSGAGFDIYGKANKHNVVPIGFKNSAGYYNAADIYTYIKVDTGFETYSGFYTNMLEISTIENPDIMFSTLDGLYVSNIEVVSANTSNANMLFESVFGALGAITKDVVIDVNIAASLFDFKANKTTSVDKILSTDNKAATFLSSIGYGGKAAMNKIGERPIDNAHFFNWNIPEFLDTPIEMDGENRVDGFFEIYLT